MSQYRSHPSVQSTRRAPPVLPPPVIPAAHDGRGLGLYLLDDEQRPLAVTILAVHLEKDDIIKLYWNDILLDTQAYVPSDGSQMTFLVAPSRIPEGSGRVHYTWEDPLAPVPDPSTPLDVVVKRAVPGGTDPDPTTEINENLTPPQGIPSLIDAEQATKGVDVIIGSYQNRSVGDTVWLSWHGQILQKDVPPGVQSFEIHVDQDVIERAGETDQLVVRYEIRDEVNNRSKWSPSAGGEVDLGSGALDAPHVPAADAQGRVDYEALTGDLDVVLGPYTGMKVNDFLVLNWKGEGAGGQLLPEVNIPHTVVDQDLPGGAFVKVPKAAVAAVLQGQVRLRYQLVGGANPVSRNTSIRVTGRLSLRPPKVLEAEDSVLDPVKVPPQGVNVRIEQYTSMAEGDLLLIEWVGRTRSGGISYHYKEVTVQGVQVGNPIEQLFDKTLVQHIAGGSLELYYTLTSVGGARSASDKQSLTVRESSTMPRPDVLHAQGDVLDPADVPNGTTVTCRKGLFTAGDELEMSWVGPTQTEGDDTYYERRSLSANQAQQDQDFTIDSKYIIRNSEKDVYVFCRMMNRQLDSEIFALKIRALSTELLPPEVKEAAGGKLDPMQARNGAHVTVRYPGMQASDRIEVRWLGVGAPSVPEVGGDAKGFVDVPIPAATVGRSIGRTVQVSFVRIRDGVPTPSQVLEMVVDALDTSVLSDLELDHDNNGQLDLDTFQGSPSLRVGPWPFIAAGQRYWLVGTGESADGGAYRHEFRSHIPVVAGEVSRGLVMEVYRNELEKLAPDKKFTLNLMVNFQGENDPFNAQAFAPCEVVVTGGVGTGDLPPPVVSGTTGDVLDPITARAGARVRVTYPQMSANDQIALSWKGVSGVGTPSISPVPGDSRGYVDIDVPASAVGANIGKTVEVSYTRTRNGSTRPSQLLPLRVQYLQSRDLERPTLDEAPNGELDLDSFAGNPTLRAKPWPFIAAGQRYWLEGAGTLKGGAAYEHLFRQNVTVTAAEVGTGLVITQIARSELEKLELDKPLRLTLKVNFEGINDLTQTQGFPVLEVIVKEGAGNGELPAPVVEDAALGVLDPMAAINGARVRVAYPSMQTTDTIQLKWLGSAGAGTPTLPDVGGSSNGFVDIPVPVTAVAANIGKSVEVHYVRKRNGTELESEVLDLRIDYLQPTDLDTPVVKEASNGVLDLDSFTGPATFLVEPWPFIAAGQRYWLEGKGTEKGGTPYTYLFRTNVTVPQDAVTKGLQLPNLYRSELEKLEEGKPFDLTFKVNFEGVNDQPNTQAFPLATVNIERGTGAGELPEPGVEGATAAGALNPILARTKAVVKVVYPQMLQSDRIALKWVGVSGPGTPTIAPVDGRTAGFVNIDVPASAVGANIGKTIEVTYTRTRSGRDLDSKVLSLRIQYLQSTDLKTPVLKQAANGELDLKSFTGDAQLDVELWPFAAQGQRYWLTGRGTLKAGGDYEHAFRTNVTLSANDVSNGKLELTIQRDQLNLLKLDAELSLTLQVNFEGINDLPNSQGFPPTRVKVVEKGLPVAEVEKATGPNKDQLDMNDFYNASSVRVTVRKYAGMAAGDTVMLRWQNPRSTWRSDIVTVGALIDLTFQVPRMELIDSIGQTVPLDYTVIRGGVGSREFSEVLSLVVARQPILLGPPTYTAASRTLTVRYAQAAANHTVKVRWDGAVLRETDTQLVNPNGNPFVIDQAWVTENAGKTVLVNYSISRQLPTERLLFSQVLRLQL